MTDALRLPFGAEHAYMTDLAGVAALREAIAVGLIDALAEGRLGQAFLIDEASTTLTPYALVRADFDSGRFDEEALGAGVGLSLRHWFDETGTVAHRGFVDLDIQARERIAGSERASGVLVTVTLGR